ncbi:MAG: protein kinase [Phycisphaerales bacterium]|nr:protein kinase [Phycisphaerales bacterium]
MGVPRTATSKRGRARRAKISTTRRDPDQTGRREVSMDANESSHDEEMLAQELRNAFGLGPDASGFEVDLSPPSGAGSSAKFRGFGGAPRHRRGTCLGDFEVLSELGRGGMGVVYRARQLSLGREVALKVLPDYAHRGPMAIQRFRTEARAAARLQHTNIVPIYAQGEHEGTYFYAMELIDGSSLDTAIRCRTRLLSPSNPALSQNISRSDVASGDAETTVLPPSAQPRVVVPDAAPEQDARTLHRTRHDFSHLARLLSEVADGLEHAHAAGVIHRDIKPQNLLVGVDERLHITDFGLARLADAPSITVSGEVMGTPAYLSPEQARADQKAIDQRTDVYSLGVTLYELLTLRRPFRGETREQILTGIKETEPTPPRTFDEHIPKDLQTICLKAMEKEVGRRYPTAAALAEDLRRFADGRPILSRPAGPLTKAIKWARRHKAATTAIVASFVVLLLSAGLAASVISARHAEADTAVDKVYAELVFYNYRADEDQLATLDRAEEMGGDETRITMLRALATLFDKQADNGPKAALALLDEAIDEDPDNVDIQYLRAIALERTGRDTESRAVIANADTAGGATAGGWLFRGLALQYDDVDEAILSYEKACDLRSADGDIFLQAMLLLARGRNQQMYFTRTVDDLGAIVRPLEQIVDFNLYGAYPHNLLSIAHRLAAEVYTGSEGARNSEGLAAEHYHDAIRWAQSGQQADPTDPLPYFSEGMVHQSRGDFAAALAAFNAAEAPSAGSESRMYELLHYRWRLHYWLSEYDAAAADFAAYKKLATKFDTASAYYLEFFPMLIAAERGDHEDAIARAYAMSAPDDGKYNALHVVWTVTALRVLGEAELAETYLSDTASHLEFIAGEIPEQTSEWVTALYRMTAGEITLEETQAMALQTPQPWRLTGEAQFHAGAMALVASDRATARERFKNAWHAYDDQLRYTYFGELLARRMAQDAEWPSWIKSKGT